jgi:tRNA-modifying protein YgfZ
MSTQQVKKLTAGQGAATLLTSEIGRMIDRLILYAHDDEVIALTGEGNTPTIIRYLMRYVFYQDDFRMTDITAETAVLALYGATAPDTLRHAGVALADLPRHHWQPATLASQPITLHRTDPLEGDGYFVLVGREALAAVQAALVEAGATPIDEARFEHLRIQAGQPRFGREITADYIPLEANLWDDVSFSKGCYIGQEIIARMESRGKIAKQLVRLQAALPLDGAVGQEITADGRPAGKLTSAAGTWGMAYIKTAALRDNTPLTLGQQCLYPFSPQLLKPSHHLQLRNPQSAIPNPQSKPHAPRLLPRSHWPRRGPYLHHHRPCPCVRPRWFARPLLQAHRPTPCGGCRA